jgi:hypothetical protein
VGDLGEDGLHGAKGAPGDLLARWGRVVWGARALPQATTKAPDLRATRGARVDPRALWGPRWGRASPGPRGLCRGGHRGCRGAPAPTPRWPCRTCFGPDTHPPGASTREGLGGPSRWPWGAPASTGALRHSMAPAWPWGPRRLAWGA